MFRFTWQRPYQFLSLVLLVGLFFPVYLERGTRPALALAPAIHEPKLWTAIGIENKSRAILQTVNTFGPAKHNHASATVTAMVPAEYASQLSAYQVADTFFVGPKGWQVRALRRDHDGSTRLLLTNPQNPNESASFAIVRAGRGNVDPLVTQLFPKTQTRQSSVSSRPLTLTAVPLRKNVFAYAKPAPNGLVEYGLVEVEWEGVYGVVSMTVEPTAIGFASAVLHDFAQRYSSLAQFAK